MAVIELFFDGKKVEAREDETLLQVARRMGKEIPTLCHRQGEKEKNACLVCALLDVKSKRFIPACSTFCQAGMEVESSTKQVKDFRKKVIELILSEHRGDCEGPCKLVCPQSYDIPHFMHLVENSDGPVDFQYNPEICESCGGKCEKVCRRQKIDKAVEIRKLLRDFGQETNAIKEETHDERYTHRDSKVPGVELHVFDRDNEKTGCLLCPCRAKDDCLLRQLATETKAKRSTYLSAESVPLSVELAGELVFEGHKCVKCGRCVSLANELNPTGGPTLAYRGQQTKIMAPIGSDFEQAFSGHEETFVEVCPVGAIGWKDRR